ncbi:MAG: hypothetical protein WAQ28_04410 [Bacteroidia bacterium]
MKQLLSILLFVSSATVASAQQYNDAAKDSMQASQLSVNPARSKFLLTGYSAVTIESDGKEKFNIGQLGFSPIFLWKPSKNIFFEAEPEMELNGEELEIGLEYANISYIMNKYITLRAGKFLAPFGIFQDRLHASWINKLPTVPLGFGHDGVGTSAEIGLALSGGIPIGPSKMNYAVYVSNGPQLNTGEDEPGEEGMLIYENSLDNNLNKALGGRLGILPFSNSSLELGGSAQYAMIGDEGSNYENVTSLMYSADLSFTQQVDFLKGALDVKAQMNAVNVSKADYNDPDDSTGLQLYTYNNNRSIIFGQLAYRPAMLNNKVLKNFETVFRYSVLDLPEGAKENEDVSQIAIGLNYWITWRSVIKFAYQKTGHQENYFLQFATSF